MSKEIWRPGLSLNTFRVVNLLRCKDFTDGKGNKCHPTGVLDWSISEWLEALVGEVGEFANLHKKVRRGDLTMAEALPQLGEELADVLTYLDLLAARCDINLAYELEHKFNLVSARVGSAWRINDYLNKGYKIDAVKLEWEADNGTE